MFSDNHGLIPFDWFLPHVSRNAFIIARLLPDNNQVFILLADDAQGPTSFWGDRGEHVFVFVCYYIRPPFLVGGHALSPNGVPAINVPKRPSVVQDDDVVRSV